MLRSSVGPKRPRSEREGADAMWESVQVSVGTNTLRGRFRMEGRCLVLEWRGGRVVEWCGLLKPEVVAASRLKQLGLRHAVAA